MLSLRLSVGLPFDEDLDEVGCHILSKAKKILRRDGLCGEENEIYVEDLEAVRFVFDLNAMEKAEMRIKLCK